MIPANLNALLYTFKRLMGVRVLDHIIAEDTKIQPAARQEADTTENL